MDVRETSPESGRAMGPLKQSAGKAALSPTLLLMTPPGETHLISGRAGPSSFLNVQPWSQGCVGPQVSEETLGCQLRVVPRLF